jgi:hypothetical protein
MNNLPPGYRRLYGTQRLPRVDPFQLKPTNNRATRVAKMMRNKHKLNTIAQNKTRRNSLESSLSQNSVESTSSQNSLSSQSIGSISSIGTRRSISKLKPIVFNNQNNAVKTVKELEITPPINIHSFTGINLPNVSRATIMTLRRPISPIKVNNSPMNIHKSRRARKSRRNNRR